MSGPSYEYAGGTLPPTTLKPSTDDTYDWATIQDKKSGRSGVKLLKATAGSSLPPFTQKVPYTQSDMDDNPGAPGYSKFKVEASPKWFSFVGTETDDQGNVTVTLGVQAGKTLASGKVVSVVTKWGGVGMPGSGKTKEYFYQIS